MSMSFYGAKMVDGKHVNPVPSKVYNQYAPEAYANDFPQDRDPPENPDYREDLAVNFCNGNAAEILEWIQVKVEDGIFADMDIDTFIQKFQTLRGIADFLPLPDARERIDRLVDMAQKLKAEFGCTLIYGC